MVRIQKLSEKQKMKRGLNFFLKLSIGIIIILVLFYKIGIKEIYETLLMLNPFLLLIVIILYLLLFVIGAFNIKILVDRIKKLNFLKIIKYHFLSWSIGLFVPGKIGEFSIIYFLKKDNIPVGKGSTIAVIDKLITIISVSTLAVIGFFVLSSFTKYEAIRLVITLGVTLFIIFFFIITDKGRGLIKRYILRKYAERFAGFSKTFFHYLKNERSTLFLNFTLTFAKWLIASSVTYILFLSLGTNLNLFYIILIDAMATIIGLIPITMSGLGVKESAAVFLYHQIGAPAHVTLTVYLICTFLNYLIALIVYLKVGIKEKLPFR